MGSCAGPHNVYGCTYMRIYIYLHTTSTYTISKYSITQRSVASTWNGRFVIKTLAATMPSVAAPRVVGHRVCAGVVRAWRFLNCFWTTGAVAMAEPQPTLGHDVAWTGSVGWT